MTSGDYVTDEELLKLLSSNEERERGQEKKGNNEKNDSVECERRQNEFMEVLRGEVEMMGNGLRKEMEYIFSEMVGRVRGAVVSEERQRLSVRMISEARERMNIVGRNVRCRVDKMLSLFGEELGRMKRGQAALEERVKALETKGKAKDGGRRSEDVRGSSKEVKMCPVAAGVKRSCEVVVPDAGEIAEESRPEKKGRLREEKSSNEVNIRRKGKVGGFRSAAEVVQIARKNGVGGTEKSRRVGKAGEKSHIEQKLEREKRNEFYRVVFSETQSQEE